MELLKRLSYLIKEGFEIKSVSGYESPHPEVSGKGKIIWVERDHQLRCTTHVEEISADNLEIKRASRLFLEHITKP